MRAGEPITRGTFVCEYVGEVIDEQEANKRRRRFDIFLNCQQLKFNAFYSIKTMNFEIWDTRYGREGCGFIFEVDARVNDMSRLIEGEASYAIDATKHGNVSRYINHR